MERAYTKAMEGEVKGSKALGVPGAGSYLYPVIKRIVEESEKNGSSN